MLGPGRYLLGVVEILLLGGFAWLGGTAVRRWLLPEFEGAPAHLSTAVIALALLVWPAELLGSFGGWDPVPYLVLVAVVGLGLWKFVPQPVGEGGHPHPTQQVGVRVTSLPTLDRIVDSGNRCRSLCGRREDAALNRHDRIRFDLVPRAIRSGVLPERRHLVDCTSSPRSSSPGSIPPTAKSSTRQGCSPSAATCFRRC